MKTVKTWLMNVSLMSDSISLYTVIKILWAKLIKFDIDQRAAAVSFSLMLAVFPGVIFLFTLIPYIPIKNLDRQIMQFLQEVMPKGLYQTTARTIFDIISRPRKDILSFGFLFTVFAATNGMTSLMRAFNMALHTREKRTYLKARLIGFLLMLLLLLVQITAILFLLVGNLLIKFLSSRDWQLTENTNFMFLKNDLNYYLVEIFRYGSVFLIFYLAICVIYYFGPAVSKKFKFFNFGALLATILCMLSTNGLSYFIATANTYNKLYGSMGTLIALMIWVYLLSLILILGFEINTSLRDAYFENKKEKSV